MKFCIESWLIQVVIGDTSCGPLPADACDVMTECHVASQTKASKQNKHVIAFSAFDWLGLEPAINR